MTKTTTMMAGVILICLVMVDGAVAGPRHTPPPIYGEGTVDTAFVIRAQPGEWIEINRAENTIKLGNGRLLKDFMHMRIDDLVLELIRSGLEIGHLSYGLCKEIQGCSTLGEVLADIPPTSLNKDLTIHLRTPIPKYVPMAHSR